MPILEVSDTRKRAERDWRAISPRTSERNTESDATEHECATASMWQEPKEERLPQSQPGPMHLGAVLAQKQTGTSECSSNRGAQRLRDSRLCPLRTAARWCQSRSR